MASRASQTADTRTVCSIPPVLLETGETTSAPHSAFDGTIETTINGAPARLERAQHKTLLNALRENAALDRLERGLRRGRVRRVHGVARWDAR